MANMKDIDNIVELLDSMMEKGTERIKLKTSEEADEQVTAKKSYGRCDFRPGRKPEETFDDCR